MSISTEIGFYFEFDTQRESNQEYWVKAEVELESGGYTFDIFTDNDCKKDITRVVKDLRIDLYKDIDRATFKQADLKRQEYAKGSIHPADTNDTYSEILEAFRNV